MKRGSTLFLKAVIVVIAIAALAGMIRFPQTEGRAANLDLLSIYSDPFIIYLYIASTPFFVALYQAFKLLGQIEKNKVFSEVAVNTLRNIKYCGMVFIGFIASAMLFIMMTHGEDDPAGSLAMGVITIFAGAVVATGAGVFQKLLQKAVDMKSENDLTV